MKSPHSRGPSSGRRPEGSQSGGGHSGGGKSGGGKFGGGKSGGPAGGRPGGQRFGKGAPTGGRRGGPPGLAARELAADLVAGVAEGRLLDALLDGGELAKRFEALEVKDRALVRAITGVALRRSGEIADVLGRLIEKPMPDAAKDLKPILTVAVAQMLFMEVPDHAAVSLAVEATDRVRGLSPWKGLVNAVLRRLGRERAELTIDVDAVWLNTPIWLMQRWFETYGEETARAFAAMHAIEPSLDLAVKEDPAHWAEVLGGTVLPTGGVRLVAHGAVENLPGFEEGAWWVQDAAASLPVHLLGDLAGKKVADLCAAPGGKTAMLAARGANVTAVDASGRRLERLKANLARLSLAANVVKADVAEWMGGPFDAVLLDAPCSATGTIRRHPDVAFLKGEADIAGLAVIQRRLLDQAIRLVKPGGLLVYCTCSLEPEEGPEQIRRLGLIDAPVERVPITPDEVFGFAEMITPDGDLRTLPSQLPNPDARLAGLDGFYAARLRRL